MISEVLRMQEGSADFAIATDDLRTIIAVIDGDAAKLCLGSVWLNCAMSPCFFTSYAQNLGR